jgi:hypothetical protein
MNAKSVVKISKNDTQNACLHCCFDRFKSAKIVLRT